ncbi:Oligopeptide-binding protein AppA [Zhongshania aliphaticivorans]|uniref:Oligopeptide-binding protein AppA n=1 Tax=Zhongshania aliphaticivorans TaxID=1470434 RepID=A0A5S9NHG6_9GAMM|nr:extracellular solute-binding protein [Zhongshania aliphaticivorans]CAA0089162.1 Oligopeptide-binding protein AppA [Zhongshania aliphaticivorans]CAA0095830.1 Oligopeptide-binding protein AppA [Zhongshania aliphaticivorans]
MRNLLILTSLIFLALNSIGAAALPKELPKDLVWQTNNSDPIFADPNAERGGRFRQFVTTFPLTLRLVGPDSNGSFASYMRANNLSLVGIHPNTLKPIPELATHWAFGSDGHSIYFRLDPDARWSDGRPVTADDYVFGLDFMRSKYILAPWYNNYFSEIITALVKYDDHTIGIEGATPKPEDEMLFEYSVSPVPSHFHKLDENWVRDYNWRIEPNTGPYLISEIRKGKFVEFTRKKQWWANDKRYFKYRYNPDHIRVKLIRDLNIAYQYFRKGELDTFPLLMPRFWHKKAQGEIYEKGYVGKIKFYNDVPQPISGLFLNEDAAPLNDKNVRYAIAHALHVDKVINTVLHGDYERLQTAHDGYGDYTNTTIRAREFDLKKADDYLNKAGWSERGSDGIRVKDGTALSIRITYYNSGHNDRLVILAQEARKAGIDFQLQLLDASAAFKQIMENKHQAAWMGWSGGGLSPRYWEFYHSDNAHKAQTNNVTNTDNKDLDSKIMAYRTATEKDTRIKLAHELEQMVHDQGSFIPTFKVPYTREAFWRWIKLPANYGTRTSDSLFDPLGGSGGLFWIDNKLQQTTLDAKSDNKALPKLMILDETWGTP